MKSSRVVWRAAAVVAFAATAALAVALSRGAPMDTTSFVSTRNGIVAAREQPGQRCAVSRLRIRVDRDGSARRYAVEFTNISAAACTMAGYPSVSAYGPGGAQVGNAAGRGAPVASPPVVLAPGASAHAPVVASAGTFPARSCHPVTADGLHIVPPGETAGSDVRRALRACSATGSQAPVFLRILAVQPGLGVSLSR